MPRTSYIFLLLTTMLLGLISCRNMLELDDITEEADPIALRGIHAVIDNGTAPSRAVMPLVDSIGKFDFLSTDEIIFTLIERTKRPIRPTFSYGSIHNDEGDVHYACNVEETTKDGNTIRNVSWGRTAPNHDIFWSDGSEPHTFIGYILPHNDDKTAEQSDFDWHYDHTRGYYYGSIGAPTETTETIDYSATPAAGQGAPTPYSLEKLRKEDLLLTYDTEMQNEDAMAWVRFHHGLASIRVVVTITGYSSTGIDPDAETKVTNMKVLAQPTMYKWDNKSYKAEPLEASDQSVLNTFDWGGTSPAWHQKKDMALWQSREYRGSAASRTFTFYGITAPSTQDKVKLTFDVSYPDPLDPTGTKRLQKPYTATLKLDGRQVEFRPGYCTSININLNHKDEKMTVGAEYLSWQFDDSPNEGSLRKNTTYLSYTDRNKITIVGDELATADDATWLYTATSGKIVDIYGHSGDSATDPYTICTADQLLSFAYEVKNGQDFIHKYVKLDADITLQPSKDGTKSISWIGVGDDTHVFNGFFLGSGRYINNLYGQHFFHTVGDNAVIDKLNFNNVLEVTGCGVVAHKNKGLICGCFVNGDVADSNSSTPYTGSIVGENHSFIIACAHVGSVSGYNTVGGLVGFNNGTVMASYHSGEIIGMGTSTNIHATVGKRGDGTPGTNKSIMFSCYYDQSLINHTPTLQPGLSGYPLTTAIMQSNSFVSGEKVFLYDASGNYQGQAKSLRDVAIEILGEDPSTTKTNDELTAALLADGVVSSTSIDKLFTYHFSLNEALRVFRLWLNSIAAKASTEGDDYKVQTNCHEFSKMQILFLQQHYAGADQQHNAGAEHKFVYVPASYPKIQ